MEKEDRLDSTSEGVKPPSRETTDLRNRLELYRWLFYAAVFLIIVLLVARCAHHS